MYSSKVVIVSAALSLWTLSAGAVTVTPADAMSQVGHAARVCGLVAAANYEPDTRAHPTFLTLISPDRPSTNQALTAAQQIVELTLEPARRGPRLHGRPHTGDTSAHRRPAQR
jgi:hypothetical protein